MRSFNRVYHNLNAYVNFRKVLLGMHFESFALSGPQHLNQDDHRV